LCYIFEIIADSPEELEVKKSAFSGWVMNVMDENIYDPYDPDYHYVGTFEDIEFEDDDSVEKTTATVTFMVYPYKIANEATVRRINIPTYEFRDITVTLNSAHRTEAKFYAEFNTQSSSYYIELMNGETPKKLYNKATYAIELEPGENVLSFYGYKMDATLRITYNEEVF
jgi:hypothetical protein